MALTGKQKKELAALEAASPETLGKEQAARLAELKTIQTEALDQTGVDETGLEEEPGVPDAVYVFANLQSGQSFKLPASAACPDGVTVTINGLPVSRLKGIDGQSLTGGKYGVTKVPAEQWKQITQIYGKMKMFQNLKN